MKKYNYKDYEFEIVEFSSKIDIYCPFEFKEWLKQENWINFFNFQERMLDEILSLTFNIKGKFKILIVSRGDEFKEITKVPYEAGMCNTKLNNDCFLVIDDLIAENKDNGELTASIKKEILHEWAHMIVYKYNNQLTNTLNEGLADLIPLYILDYQNDMTEYVEKLKSLKTDDIISIDYMDEFGLLDDNLEETTQNKHTYLSSYLFVLNIIKNIEDKFEKSKLDALLFFLELMRKHKKYHYEVIAEILDLPLENLKFNKFQIEALEHI
jgi:hypothetical protein